MKNGNQLFPQILSSGKSAGVTALAATAAAAARTVFFLYINAAAGRTLYLVRFEKQVLLIELFSAVTTPVVYPGHISPPLNYWSSSLCLSIPLGVS